MIKIAAFVYLIIYYGVIVIFRSYLLYKNTGINPIKNMEREGIEGFIERIFGVCFVAIPVIVLNFVFIENNYQWLIPIYYLESTWTAYIGIFTASVGLMIAMIAQLQMGNSWRLGLDRQTKTDLVTAGLFKYSRNPIYLGILIAHIGFFMMMPNALSFGLTIVTYVALEVKIRCEEELMEERHGAFYKNYRSRIRRWI